MATYQYEALDRTGSTQKGSVEASSADEAIQQIKLRALYPLSVECEESQADSDPTDALGSEVWSLFPRHALVGICFGILTLAIWACIPRFHHTMHYLSGQRPPGDPLLPGLLAGLAILGSLLIAVACINRWTYEETFAARKRMRSPFKFDLRLSSMRRLVAGTAAVAGACVLTRAAAHDSPASLAEWFQLDRGIARMHVVRLIASALVAALIVRYLLAIGVRWLFHHDPARKQLLAELGRLERESERSQLGSDAIDGDLEARLSPDEPEIDRHRP